MISELRQQAQEKALFSKYLLNFINDAAFCLKSDARFIYVNDATCRLLEYSQLELLSLTLQDVVLDFREETWLEQWRALAQQGSLSFRCQFRTKNERILPVEITITYVKERDWEFGCAYTCELAEGGLKPQAQEDTPESRETIEQLNREISQLRKTEAELTTTLSLLSSTLNSAAYGIIAVSFEGEVLNYNQKFLEMWQIPESMTLSKDSQECQNFFSSKLKNPEIFRCSVWEVSRESSEETYNVLELKDGRIFAQYSKPQQIGQRSVGRVWSIWDLTEFKLDTEKALQQPKKAVDTKPATEEAKQLSELRARFFSTLCHQFRSFLNIISFSNSLLKRSLSNGTEPKKITYLDNTQTAVEQITKLLDELIFLGKSEVGHLKYKQKQTALDVLCQGLVSQLEPMSDSKQLVLKFINESNCSSAWVDEDLLQHILTNLLSNAIKYSPGSGKIEFKLLCEEEDLIFQIKDKGIGIPVVEQQRIFEPFYRGSNIDDIPGSGLGLAIVKNLVDMHGGRIKVESEVGVGTTFTVAISGCVGKNEPVG